MKVERPFPNINMLISFSDEDYPVDMVEPYECALVNITQVGSVDMRRIMIGNDSSLDVLYCHAYQWMDLEG